MQYCVIPVKGFKNAKARLSGLLSSDERSQLAMAMYQDVLDVAMQAAPRQPILVISQDAMALEVAERRGALILEEVAERGQSAAVERAAQLVEQLGGTSLLSLPIDVPLITVEDLAALWGRFQDLQRIHASPSALALLTPSRDRTGTNALLRYPPSCLPCRFGYESLQQHLKEAKLRGLVHELMENPRLALDIDTPDDLAAFINYPRGDRFGASRTERALLAMNVLPRVS